MALLNRFLRLNDHGETGVFTFIVTKNVTRDNHRDVTSKDFWYGYHRWSLAFSRHEKTVGIYLVWRNPSEGMRVTLDFNLTLLNRDHFSQNQSYSRKRVKFSRDSPVQGTQKFLLLSTLENGQFMDRNGEFQIEIGLSSLHSSFEHKFKMNQSLFAHSSKLGKFETSYFSYGHYDWSLAVYPNGRSDSQIGVPEGDTGSSMTIYLTRHTGLDRTCRLKFVLKLGDGDGQIDSGMMDEPSDSDGRSYGWLPRVKMADKITKGALKLVVEMVSVNVVSLVELPVVPPNPIGCPLYDKDKLSWELESDMNGDTLRLRLVHKDAKNIPRNHIRYVCWSAYLLKNHPKLKSALGDGDDVPRDYTAKIPLDQKFYFQYYVQDDTEAGTLMDTKIPLKEITDPNLGYLHNRTNIRLHVEWLHSCLLFQATYHHYDDVTRIQTHQMRQEIQNLKLENEMLEQRLITYETDGSFNMMRLESENDPRRRSNLPQNFRPFESPASDPKEDEFAAAVLSNF